MNRDLFMRLMAQTSQEPLLLEIERASGVYLYDSAGKAYMDLISGIGVSNVGHTHHHIVDAIRDQARKFSHLMVYGEFIQSPQLQLASMLTSRLPEQLQCVYFVNSGAEAIEGAVKLARRYSGRSGIVSFQNGYHGSTMGALSLMGNEEFKRAYRPLLPGVTILEYEDWENLERIDQSVACVVTEVVQAESGVHVPETSWLKALRKRCDEEGVLLIFDEVQTGMGRTGKMFAFEHSGVVPDILVLAKALGGGLPLGAFISARQIFSVFTHHPPLGHITTFGGNAISCAAGKASMEIILQRNLIDKVQQRSKLFRQLLGHQLVKEIRSAGLLLAVEFKDEKTCKAVIAACLRNGILTDWFLFAPHCMRIAPPLIITEDEIKRACNLILKALEEVEQC